MPVIIPGFEADELLAEFLLEGDDLVQLATQELLALERNAGDTSRIDSALRAFHTLKGSAALFDFAPMTAALHAAEDLLTAVRDTGLSASAAILDPLLQTIGATETWLAFIAQHGVLPESAAAQSGSLMAVLRAPLAHTLGNNPHPSETGIPDWMPPFLSRHAEALAGIAAPRTAFRYVPAADCFFHGQDPLALLRAVPGLAAAEIDPPEAWPEPLSPFTCHLRITAIAAASREDIARVFRFVADQVSFAEIGAAIAPASTPLAEDTTARFIRVDSGKIDAMVDIVGELIVAKNSLAHIGAALAGSDPALARSLGASRGEIDRLVGNMHRAVMAVRMTGLARIFRRLPRLVRDAAASSGKTIDFTITGDDVEADKSIVDALFEPLLHVLRNAVDHGIEPPTIRAASGKPPSGKIALSAARQADRIVLTITDDGAGIDPGKIRAAAARRQVSNAAALDAMDGAALQNLIFAPGFSTASEITSLSGRGVGMDAVRSAVEALGGNVTLESTPGAGTSIRLALPQAVLITTIVTVRVGQEAFGIPLDAVIETARIGEAAIHRLRGGEALVLRGRTIPLLHLGHLLGRETEPPAGDVKVLITACGQDQVAIGVDAIGERIDVLLRPLAGFLSAIPGLAGAALLGDGSVLMVLNLAELAG